MVKPIARLTLQVLLVLCCPLVASANIVATYTLGLPQVNGNTADYFVTLDFLADDGNEVVFFSVDVQSSHAQLTANGTDYSAFSFIPSLPLLANWSPVVDFGVGPLKSATQLDTFADPLTSGFYLLGTLSVDFSGTTLSPGVEGAVAVEAPQSVIGVELPGNSASFQFVDVDVLVVPEPGAGLLVICCGLGLVPLWRRASYSTGHA